MCLRKLLEAGISGGEAEAPHEVSGQSLGRRDRARGSLAVCKTPALCPIARRKEGSAPDS